MNYIEARCPRYDEESKEWVGAFELVVGSDLTHTCTSTKKEQKRAHQKVKKLAESAAVKEGRTQCPDVEDFLDFEVEPTESPRLFLKSKFESDNYQVYSSSIFPPDKVDEYRLLLAFLPYDHPKALFYKYNNPAILFLKFFGFDTPNGDLFDIRGPAVLFFATEDLKHLKGVETKFYMVLLEVYNYYKLGYDQKTATSQFKQLKVNEETIEKTPGKL